jgi:hypothetical protein
LNEQTLVRDYEAENQSSQHFSVIDQLVPDLSLSIPKKPSLILLEKSDTRTVAPHGITRPEIRRLSDSAKFMEDRLRAIKDKRLSIYFAVMGDDLLHLESGEARYILKDFRRYLNQAQVDNGYPQYCIEVLEVIGGLHGNFIFIADEKIALSLCRSFSNYMQGGYGRGSGFAMKRAYDLPKLVSEYLIKERTPQAKLSKKGRKKGSHRLEGGGDRVSLSKALKADAIEPWQKTNAHRAKFMSVVAVKAPEAVPKPLPPERISP